MAPWYTEMINETVKLKKLDLGNYVLVSFGSVVEGELPQPGQFYMFYKDYVKKPFSVAFMESNSIFFIIKKVGPFTNNIPDEVRVEGPYGKPFPAMVSDVFLVSGGAGIAPICFLAQRLTEQNLPFTWVHGESIEQNVTLLDYLPVKPQKVSVEPTLVTDLLPEKEQFYCACGPKPMLKGLVTKWGTNGLVSLEERMACGFGACYGCVITTISGYQRVCKEGPIFEAGEVLWQKL